MTKPTGAICNLDCTYCFFLSKEALYPGSKFRMEDDLLEQYIRQVIESQQGQYVTIAWQGGEPTLMGLDFFKHSMELVEKHKRPGMTVEHTIQTNGTLLTPEWADFFHEHGFLVGLSMDGPPDIHDAQRVDKGGKPTHSKVLKAAHLLTEHDAEFNILCTVHALNAERGREVYRYFRDEVGARYIQYIPIIERATPEFIEIAEQGWGDRVKGRPLYEQTGSLVTARSITTEQWGRFLIDVFEEWVRRDVGSVYVQMIDVTLANFVGEPPALCIYSETCGSAMALEHNGDLYSCDHFVEPAYMVGNIRDTHMLELAASPRQVKFGKDKRDTLPRFCRECDVRFACHGGCPKDRFIDDPYGEPGLNYLCAGYKEYFGHVTEPMRVMEELLRRGRAPAEIMRWYAGEDAARGRNAPCSCGSGRKFKRCHGDSPLPSAADLDTALGPQG
ncbi:MAG: anaerobic sulfatase maturase [Chloroflexota bacterium]